MKCKCGIENVSCVKFCGTCGLALADGAASALPNGAMSATPELVPMGGATTAWHPTARALKAIMAVVVVVAAARCHRSVDSGATDKTGTLAINPQFDQAGPFSEGLAPVRSATRTMEGMATLTRLAKWLSRRSSVMPRPSLKGLPR